MICIDYWALIIFCGIVFKLFKFVDNHNDIHCYINYKGGTFLKFSGNCQQYFSQLLLCIQWLGQLNFQMAFMIPSCGGVSIISF